ncbi:MAG TPA: cytochrome c biogenesis protein CcdA [Bellilinea sp.]
MTDLEISMNPSRPTDRLTTFVHACLFVFGFSLIFVIGWGGAATLLGQVFITYKTLLAQIGGAVIILFGLSTLGLFRMPGMYYSDTRPQFSSSGKSSGWLASIGMGVFFAAGWTPCIGTTLGAILTLGFSQPNATQAMVLTSGYALGLGIPFLLLGIGLDRAFRFLSRFRRHMRTIQLINGLFLIALGAILVLGKMTVIAIWAQKNGWYFDLPLAAAASPTYLIAMVAGLISFASPCVLPLVPAYLGYLSGKANYSKSA